MAMRYCYFYNFYERTLMPPPGTSISDCMLKKLEERSIIQSTCQLQCLLMNRQQLTLYEEY